MPVNEKKYGSLSEMLRIARNERDARNFERRVRTCESNRRALHSCEGTRPIDCLLVDESQELGAGPLERFESSRPLACADHSKVRRAPWPPFAAPKFEATGKVRALRTLSARTHRRGAPCTELEADEQEEQ